MIRLAVFDIDRTLIAPELGEMAPETIDAIHTLQRKGVKTAIASGRPLSFLPEELRAMGFDYFILSNGSYVTDAAGTVLHRETLDQTTTDALVAEVVRRGWPIDLRYLGGRTSGNPSCTVTEFMRRHWGGLKMKKPPKNMLVEYAPEPGELPVSFCGYIPEEDLPAFVAKFPQLDFLSVFEGPMCDINKAGVSKASGIETICTLTGISMAQTIAFGDDRNDLEMVASAGIGVAMGNAIESVKAAADYVTDTCENLGVVKALAHFGLL